MSAATQARLAPATIDRDAVAQAIVSEVVSQAREKYARQLLAIILTGSFARGEASLLAEQSLCRVLGDAEFLLVFRRNSLRPAPAELAALETIISRSLHERGLVCAVHLDGVSPSFLRRLPAHILSYELRRQGKLVLGEAQTANAIPAFDPGQIQREDAWRLLSNRMIEWLESLAAEAGSAQPGLAMFYSTVKLWLDVGTSLLVFLQEYESGYSARAARLARLAQRPLSVVLPFSLNELSCAVDAATAWKLEPDGEVIARLGWSFCDDARRFAGLLWCWETARITGLDESSSPVQFLRSSQRQPGRWRGWLRAARECGREHQRRPWRQWQSLSRWGSPRSCIYSVAAECILRPGEFGLRANDDLPAVLRARRLRQFLPLPDAPAGTGTGDGWRQLLRETAWNYHHFVERTRT